MSNLSAKLRSDNMQDTDAGGLEDDWDALARLCGRKDWNRFLCTACWVVRSGYLVYVGGRREDRKVFADRILTKERIHRRNNIKASQSEGKKGGKTLDNSKA